MPRLRKPELLQKVLSAIKLCDWQFLQLNSVHPFRLKVFRDHESHTVRIYIWNLTHGGGPARPADEYRIQITGITRFEPEPDGKTLILGWWDEAEIFAGFDYRKHSGALGASPSIQIREPFLREAYSQGFSPCNKGNREIAIAFRPDFIAEYIRSLESIHDVGRSPTDFRILEAVAADPTSVNDADLEAVTESRRTAVASVRRTLRDTSFKNRVLTAYNHTCAICSLQLDLIQAAHIVPVAIPTSTDETSNGIALCGLHHLAFDNGLVAIDDTYKVIASESEKTRLRRVLRHGGLESFLSGLRKLILLPPSVWDRPNINYLQMGREVRHWVG